jgi:hypothetical protein
VRESCGIAAFAILALLAGLTEPVIASFVPAKGLFYAIFVLDGAFFVFAVGLTTYVSRIAPASEHTPTLSMGVAMNHVGRRDDALPEGPAVEQPGLPLGLPDRHPRRGSQHPDRSAASAGNPSERLR